MTKLPKPDKPAAEKFSQAAYEAWIAKHGRKPTLFRVANVFDKQAATMLKPDEYETQSAGWIRIIHPTKRCSLSPLSAWIPEKRLTEAPPAEKRLTEAPPAEKRLTEAPLRPSYESSSSPSVDKSAACYR